MALCILVRIAAAKNTLCFTHENADSMPWPIHKRRAACGFARVTPRRRRSGRRCQALLQRAAGAGGRG